MFGGMLQFFLLFLKDENTFEIILICHPATVGGWKSLLLSPVNEWTRTITIARKKKTDQPFPLTAKSMRSQKKHMKAISINKKLNRIQDDKDWNSRKVTSIIINLNIIQHKYLQILWMRINQNFMLEMTISQSLLFFRTQYHMRGGGERWLGLHWGYVCTTDAINIKYS